MQYKLVPTYWLLREYLADIFVSGNQTSTDSVISNKEIKNLVSKKSPFSHVNSDKFDFKDFSPIWAIRRNFNE